MLLTRVWWLYVTRGALAVLFGILALLMPTAALIALVLVFGIYADAPMTIVTQMVRKQPLDIWPPASI